MLESNSCENFLVCHWNLNSISDHNFSEVSLLNAYTSLNSFDMICFSDTCLDSRTLSQGRNQEFQGYDLISADHPSNVKRDEACIYYKNHLSYVFCTDLVFTSQKALLPIREFIHHCILTAITK